MNEEELRQFTDTLETFDTAMLVTQRGSELRSRPMAIADTTEDGRVWFITSIDSGKLQELTEHPNVNVTMQADATFLSISGAARATRDREKVNELWRDDQGIWFPEGREDPTVILLEIVPTYAEYWDRSGIEGLKFLFSAAKSAATGATVSSEGVHGKVDFPRTDDEVTRVQRR